MRNWLTSFGVTIVCRPKTTSSSWSDASEATSGSEVPPTPSFWLPSLVSVVRTVIVCVLPIGCATVPDTSSVRCGVGTFARTWPRGSRAKTIACRSCSSRLSETRNELRPRPSGPPRLPSKIRFCSGGRVSAKAFFASSRASRNVKLASP